MLCTPNTVTYTHTPSPSPPHDHQLQVRGYLSGSEALSAFHSSYLRLSLIHAEEQAGVKSKPAKQSIPKQAGV